MAKIFTKLNISDTVATSGTRVFKKLTTEAEKFTINGTYLLNETITELPIVNAEGEDLMTQRGISVVHIVGGAKMNSTAIYEDDMTDGKMLVSASMVPIQLYNFDTNTWRRENRYISFVNVIATNNIGEDVTKILAMWLSENANKKGQITFTIDGIGYKADDGMNWYQWMTSDYNTGGYTRVGLDSAVRKGSYYVATDVSDGTNDYKVTITDAITAGYNYVLVQG